MTNLPALSELALTLVRSAEYTTWSLPPDWGRSTSDEATRRFTWHRYLRRNGIGFKRGRSWAISVTEWNEHRNRKPSAPVAAAEKPLAPVVDIQAAMRRAGVRSTR